MIRPRPNHLVNRSVHQIYGSAAYPVINIKYALVMGFTQIGKDVFKSLSISRPYAWNELLIILMPPTDAAHALMAHPFADPLFFPGLVNISCIMSGNCGGNIGIESNGA